MSSSSVKIKISPAKKTRHYLQGMILGLKDGQRLPSMRELSRVCEVSIPVISKVLEGFRAEGHVEFRTRSGVYRTASFREREKVLPVLYFDYPEAVQPGNFANVFLGYIAGQLVNYSAVQKIWIMRNEPDWQRVIKELHERGVKFLLTYAMGMPDFEMIRQLEADGIKCLHVFPNLIQLPKPSIAVDDELLVRTQIEHLVSRGYKKIAYLHAVCDEHFHRGQLLRLNSFYRFTIDYKLHVEPEWVRYVGFGEDMIANATCELLSGRERPDALIIYDEHARAVYSAIHQLGMLPGKDVAIIGTDDMPWAEHLHPSLTSIQVSCIRVADNVLRIFDGFMSDSNQFDENEISMISTPLIVRESTEYK